MGALDRAEVPLENTNQQTSQRAGSMQGSACGPGMGAEGAGTRQVSSVWVFGPYSTLKLETCPIYVQGLCTPVTQNMYSFGVQVV